MIRALTILWTVLVVDSNTNSCDTLEEWFQRNALITLARTEDN